MDCLAFSPLPDGRGSTQRIQWPANVPIREALWVDGGEARCIDDVDRGDDGDVKRDKATSSEPRPFGGPCIGSRKTLDRRYFTTDVTQ